MEAGDQIVINEAGLDQLLKGLIAEEYEVYGPTLGDDAIVYEAIEGIRDLPRGIIDEQEAGHYRLRKSVNNRIFDFVVGPHSWKKYLFPPRLELMRVKKTADGFTVKDPEDETSPPKMAFIGVRGCELAALHVQDKVFLGGEYVDRHYRDRRAQLFIVAVNCTRAGGTCFCVSMDTGPKAGEGFDLSLTELDGEILVEIGSERGARIIDQIPSKPANSDQKRDAEERIQFARENMGRSMDRSGVEDLLRSNLEHPRWDEVGERCLSCTNCTMVCPTCFCSTVEDVNSLRGDESSRIRYWDSCFSMEFSYMHGGGRRPHVKDRYRQWLTHKFSSWYEQFGTSGCVGCGRCITWCPPGIDVTEEIGAIRDTGQIELRLGEGI